LARVSANITRLSIQQVYAKYPNSGCALPYAHARGQKRDRTRFRGACRIGVVASGIPSPAQAPRGWQNTRLTEHTVLTHTTSNGAAERDGSRGGGSRGAAAGPGVLGRCAVGTAL